MSILVQDVLNRVADHLGSYDTGQSTTEQRIRATDSAVNYIAERLSFWNQQDIYQFKFSQDTLYYDLPASFKEFLGLFYANSDYNVPANAWSYKTFLDISRKTGTGMGQNVAVTNINGMTQLMMLGKNIYQGATIDTFDTVLWTPEDDASDIAFDGNIKVQGAYSQSFTITDSLGVAILRKEDVGFDATSINDREGLFKLYVWMASTDFTAIKFRYMTDDSNYFEISTTTQSDGTAFEQGEWNLLSFDSSTKTTTGSPNQSNINTFEIEFELDTGFGTVPLMRVDWLYSVFPDRMELVYTSRVKGTNAAGTAITTITAATDTLSFDQEYLDPIALRAAYYLNPQLRADPAWQAMYKSDFIDWITIMGRRLPRLRTQNNFINTRLRR